jgi:hypothetical protein
MFGYIRRISLIFGFLLGSSSLFVIGTSLPARAALCGGTDAPDLQITKSVSPSLVTVNVTTITYKITVTNAGTCDVTANLDDTFTPNQEILSTSPASANCTINGFEVSCSFSLLANTSKEVDVFAKATSAGSVCDLLAVVHATETTLDSNPTNNLTGGQCTTAQDASTSTPPGDDGEDGGGGGTTSTTTVFTTETTTVFPVGGVQTGEGGAARSSPLVPLTIAGGLLAFGVGSYRLRRRLGSRLTR